MITSDLRALVRARHPSDRWAVFDEVRNETGFTSGTPTRAADMLALSLWRSKGLRLHGFELKVSRGDWLRELRQPGKADAIKRYCDHWWLVAGDDSVCKIEDLPPGWGLLVARDVRSQLDDGSRANADVVCGWALEVVRAAPRLPNPAPLDRLFVASIARQCARRAA